MLLLKTSYSELETSTPLIKTDKNGNFFLPYKMLGLGLSFIRTGMESAEPIGKTIISNNFKLFMTKDGYHNYILPLNIDTTIATVKTIVLNR